MTRVTLGKSRVRESRTPGSVRAKAEWLSYSTTIQTGDKTTAKTWRPAPFTPHRLIVPAAYIIAKAERFNH